MKKKINKIFDYITKITIIRQNKQLILSYLANGLKRGNNLLTLINKYKETLNDNKEEKVIKNILNKINDIIDSQGTNTPDILYKVGLLTEKEYIIVSNYNELHLGLEVVLKMNKQKNNFNMAILLFLFPPFLVTIGLFIFQPELKSFAYSVLQPINEQSTTMIRIPSYLETRTAFGLSILGFILFYSFIIYSIEFIKKYYPEKYFLFFKLSEKEFIVNTFSALLNLRKSGKSYTQSYKILKDTTKDTIVKKYYSEVYELTKQGKIQAIYEISKKFNMSNFNLSYFKIGVLNNDLDNTIDTILEYNEEKYNKQVARLVKFLPLIGEIIMTLIIVKPLIDIIMVTTVGAMNFTLS